MNKFEALEKWSQASETEVDNLTEWLSAIKVEEVGGGIYIKFNKRGKMGKRMFNFFLNDDDYECEVVGSFELVMSVDSFGLLLILYELNKTNWN